jgi:phytoene/squalene synthetase
MTNCDSILEAHVAKLPKSFDTLPAPSRVGLLSFQLAAKAMKQAFKEDQSIASVERLFDLFLQKQSTSEPLLQCAISTMYSYGVSQESILLIQDQLTAQLKRKGFDTTEQFNTFVDTVFGAFGEMSARLFGADASPSMTASLREVAKAIGVTRTLREIHVDVDHGFYMISKELLAEYEVDLDALKTTKITEGFAQLINSLIEPLRRTYSTFYSQIDRYPTQAQLSLYTFVKTQEAILDEIIWNRYDCLHTELTVSELRQTMIRFRAKRAIKQRGRK